MKLAALALEPLRQAPRHGAVAVARLASASRSPSFYYANTKVLGDTIQEMAGLPSPVWPAVLLRP